MSLRIFRISNVFAWSLAVFFGSVLFYVSQSVQRSDEQLRYIHHQVNLELEAIRVLEAEWDYLNSPMRLENLAQAYLSVELPDAQKISNDVSVVPEAQVPLVPGRKPIQVSLSSKPVSVPAPAPTAEEPKKSAEKTNVIQNADRNKFNALLEDLNGGEGF